MPTTSLRVLITSVLLFVPALPAGAEPDASFDYMQIGGLSAPEHEVRHESYRVPMSDGVEMYLEVVRPAGEGRFPVIMELSPYHGTSADRTGENVLPWPLVDGRDPGLTEYFPQRGYAVVIADLRGTGRSGGCLDELGENDARDAKVIVEWAAAQPWSNGRVGMTGMSYPAAASVLALSQQPEGLATVVPIAGLASMYDHQFQAGVPYALQWVGTMASYPLHATSRHLPHVEAADNTPYATGDNFGNDPQDTGCGWTGSSLAGGEGQLSGQYSTWHADRDFSRAATDSPIPVFLVHGVADQAARVIAAEWFFDRPPGRGDKLWLGPWNHHAPRGAQFTFALHAWFDRHLQQRDVDTGPPVEVFFSDGATFEEAQSLGRRTDVLVADAWEQPSSAMSLFPHAGGGLGAAAQSPGDSVAFTGDPRDTHDFLMGAEYDESAEETGNATFVSEPAAEDALLLGRPSLRLEASVTVPRVHLIATLYDEDSAGNRRRLTTFAMNPERRDGLAEIAPIIPGQRMELHPPGFPMAHHLLTGHRLVLRVTTSQEDKVAVFGADPRVTVFTGEDGTRLDLPVVSSPVLVEDSVPTG